jgi:hypothetical protein
LLIRFLFSLIYLLTLRSVFLWERNVRVGTNSPNLCPTRGSCKNRNMFLPVVHSLSCPIINGRIVDDLDQVFYCFFFFFIFKLIYLINDTHKVLWYWSSHDFNINVLKYLSYFRKSMSVNEDNKHITFIFSFTGFYS